MTEWESERKDTVALQVPVDDGLGMKVTGEEKETVLDQHQGRGGYALSLCRRGTHSMP